MCESISLSICSQDIDTKKPHKRIIAILPTSYKSSTGNRGVSYHSRTIIFISECFLWKTYGAKRIKGVF